MSERIKVIQNKTVVQFSLYGDNKRNSEGDFIRLHDGRILFVYSYFHGETAGDDSRCDIAGVYSCDNGETFELPAEGETPRILISARQFGEKNIMSVSLMRMSNGDLGVFYLLRHLADSTSEIMLSRSADEGESFYETIHVLPEWVRAYHVVNNCRVIRTGEETLIIPTARHEVELRKTGGFNNRGIVYFLASDDDGRTWHCQPSRLELGSVTNTTTGLQEPGIVELPNGSLYAYCRTDLGKQYDALSCDGGRHWFGPQPSRFTSPQSPMLLKRNPYSGKYYAFWNPITWYNGRQMIWETLARTQLAISDSDDGFNYGVGDGTNPENMALLENDDTRGFCYPAAFFLDKNTFLLAYCNGGQGDDICLSRLTIHKITVEV